MSEKLIEINGLQKQYKDFELDKVSFSLEPGCIMGFVGPNGAGKSTTIKLMLNLIKKNGGDIKIFGLDSVKDEIAIKQQIGFVLDDTSFHQGMTIRQAEWIVSGFYKEWDHERFNDFCKKYKLDPKKKIKTLSTGNAAKLSLALALSHNARLLILDEPTSGLDPVVRSDILDELYEVVKDPQKGVFFSSHITSDLDKLADYITFINNGRIILTASRDEIDENYAVVKGGAKQLESVKSELIRVNCSQFGFEGLTKNAPALRRGFEDKLVIEKAKIEDIILFYEKGELVC